VISPTQRPVRDNTQHSQDTGIQTPGGIRSRNPNKRAAADPRPKTTPSMGSTPWTGIKI